MYFTSLNFLAFLAVAALLYRLCALRWRAAFLLGCSYILYYAWSAEMALLLFGATTAAYFAGLGIESFHRRSAKSATVFSFVSLLVLILVLYKSAPFLRDQFGWNLFMPLGLSYYSFKLISYVVDVYWGRIPAEKQFVAFAAYAAFFPQIVAGPIQRSESFLPQIHNPVLPSLASVSLGLQRILLGFFKKFLAADNLALLVNFIYSHLHGVQVPLLLGYYAYPLQIYADFSALTDISNGAARLFGIEAPENFDNPFFAASPSDYWRRWHITLTLWLTDYIFTPLRMATRAFGNAGLFFSLLANMVLIGLWHGFRWNFALFGVLHGLYLSADALTARSRKKYYKTHAGADRIMNWLGPLLTFHLIAVGFVFFRSDSAADIFWLLSHLGQGMPQSSPEFESFWRVSGSSVLAGLAALIVAEVLSYFIRRNIFEPLPRWGKWAAYACTATAALVLFCLLLVSTAVYNPFVYAVF